MLLGLVIVQSHFMPASPKASQLHHQQRTAAIAKSVVRQRTATLVPKFIMEGIWLAILHQEKMEIVVHLSINPQIRVPTMVALVEGHLNKMCLASVVGTKYFNHGNVSLKTNFLQGLFVVIQQLLFLVLELVGMFA